MRGQKLELRLMEIAKREEVDEFIVGLPRSWNGKETPQSNKAQSIAGRLAIRAVERGWKVYLQDEHGTLVEALDYMIDILPNHTKVLTLAQFARISRHVKFLTKVRLTRSSRRRVEREYEQIKR